MPSTLDKLTEVASEKTPKLSVHAVSSYHGGVVGALSAESLPRNESQVKSIRQKLKSGSSTDPLLSVMMMCKDTMKGFVKTVTGAPDYMVFIAADRSLDNLVRFCTTDSSQLSILTFDPTFSLGAFDVTVSTYKHPLLVFYHPNEHTSQHPNLLGPILIHQQKQFSNYHYFTSTLVGCRPKMRHLHAFGTDGEKALVQACHSQFPNAIHLRCWLHFKDNLSSKLERDLRLPRNVTQEFIADIMGNVSTLEHGLVDAEDDEVFNAQLQSLEKVWNKREQACTKDDPVFYDWFLEYCKDVMKDSMLLSVRKSAGLGNPPAPYYTNAVESMKSLLKLRTNFKKLEVTAFISKLKELVDNQFAEVDRAVAGLGEYKVSEEYPKFCINPAKWFTMSEDQRQRVLKRFQSILPLNFPTEDYPHVSNSTSINEQSQDSGSASNSSHSDVNTQSDANLLIGLAIPPYIADTIWKHARVLSENNSNFAEAPGNGGKVWLVARSSESVSKSYFVQIHKGHYECESDCIYYQSCKVCAHIVAVAKKNGDLDSFLSWYNKRNHQVNTTAIAQNDLPLASVGKKKAPRKGISKQKGAKIRKICVETDSTSWSLRPALANATTVQNQLAVNVQSCSSPVIMPSQSSVIMPSQSSVIIPSQSSVIIPSQTPTPQDFAVFPAPSTPFILIMLHGNISVCTGCHQRFPRSPNGDYANPPYNMAIQHMEPRKFNSPVTGVPTSKVENAYYHVYLPCLHTNWPSLLGHDVIVPTELVPKLLSEHKMLLYQNLGIVI